VEGELLARPSDSAKPKSYTEQFDSLCPVYMGMGLSYEDFWDGDVEKAKYTYKSYMFKREQENYMLWLQGLYIYQAIGAYVPVLVTIPKKNAKAEEYINEPVALSKKAQERKEENKQKETFEKNRAFMLKFAAQHNGKFKEKNKEAR